MKNHHYHLPPLLLLTILINGRPLRALSDLEESLTIDPSLTLPNPRLKNAYIALQALQRAIISDPNNVTSNWAGSNVCSYTGIYCAPSHDNPSVETVAGIDLNGADLSGHLPEELGLLYDIALIHLNSNRFCGKVPRTFLNFKLLFELDLSNNRLSGEFPTVFLQLPMLKFLDIRFNEFEGELPGRLFEINFDALFLNHNRFSFSLPENFGSSSASVIVLANNRFRGCLPASLTNFSSNLNEIILRNNDFESCLPDEIGNLQNLTVLDFGFNQFVGPLPKTIEEMANLEVLDLSHNMLRGGVSEGICRNPKLTKLEFSYNFFTDESPICLNPNGFDDRRNCLNKTLNQRTQTQCKLFLSRPINCSSFGCGTPSSPPPLLSPPAEKCNCSCIPSQPGLSPPKPPIALPPSPPLVSPCVKPPQLPPPSEAPVLG